MNLQLAKGTRDLPPERKLAKERIIAVLRRKFEAYGFSPLETPIIERYETLVAKFAAGEGTDVSNEIFKFRDQGKRELGLRFDLTVPLSRYIAMNPQLKLPFKRYEIGEVFRDGPVKQGRFREFWQCDVDIIGVQEVAAEAELLILAADIFRELGLEVVIKINHRRLLNSILESIGIPAAKREQVILAIDKIEKLGLGQVKKELQRKRLSGQQVKDIIAVFSGNNIEKIKGKIGSEEGRQAVKEIRQLQELLEAGQVSATVDLSLARGLSYYTGMVFEVFLRKGEITSSVAGGGRYDDMIGQFSGRKIPAVGISFGVDVLSEVMQGAASGVTQALLIPIRTLPACFTLAQKLRDAGISTEVDLQQRGPGKALEYCHAKGIPIALFLGPTELAEGKVKLREMGSGEEQLVPAESIAEAITKALKR